MEDDLSDLYAEIALNEEQVAKVPLDAEETGWNEEDLSFTFVGRFLTNNHVNYNSMRGTLAAVWQPRKGIAIKSIGEVYL